MPKPSFRLRFARTAVSAWAARYSFPGEDRIAKEVGPAAKKRGYFTKPEFVELCYWKSPRTQSRVDTNSAELIQDATRIALSTPHERLRIGVPRLLYGVSWPTASVVLHFAHRDPYPILDFRALWSLGYEKPPAFYTFDFWWEYVQFCRALAKECGVSMRVLDRALWQFSKERQR
ncbi:MAG: hypothetical protein IMZ44_23655 [Planctomycetes bacterium]|nr:hypothetical protein [Planctomycetota bacterium]